MGEIVCILPDRRARGGAPCDRHTRCHRAGAAGGAGGAARVGARAACRALRGHAALPGGDAGAERGGDARAGPADGPAGALWRRVPLLRGAGAATWSRSRPRRWRRSCRRAKDGFTRYIRRDPLGLILTIAPWNYPYLTAVNTVVPGLIAGNAVILKAASQTILTGERFQAAMDKAGLPQGSLPAPGAGP